MSYLWPRTTRTMIGVEIFGWTVLASFRDSRSGVVRTMTIAFADNTKVEAPE